MERLGCWMQEHVSTQVSLNLTIVVFCLLGLHEH
jgi:hypothetical protein